MIDTYADKYAKTGGAMYRAKVLQEAESYISHIVSKVNVPEGVPFEYEDLKQEARIMVIKALDNYDRSKDNKFSTYMYIRTFGGVIQYIRNQDVLSRGRRNAVGQIREHRHALGQLLGRDPSDEELATSVDMPIAKVREALLDELHRESVDIEELPVSKRTTKDTLQQVFDREYLVDKLKTLSVKDRAIIICTYFLDMDARETSKLLGYANRNYIYSLKSKILKHLKALVS
jgi:RNA polymerase sigma factor for flagellar operon FliA